MNNYEYLFALMAKTLLETKKQQPIAKGIHLKQKMSDG